MTASLRIARALLGQSRWLLVLLFVFPLALVAAITLPGGGGGGEDAAADLLHQLTYYGVAIAAFQAPGVLRGEMKTRRIVTVISRAVSRTEYLAAMELATMTALAIYLLSFLGCALLLGWRTGAPLTGALQMAAMQLLLGLALGVLSLLGGLLLPAFFATFAALLVAAVTAALGLAPGVLLRGLQNVPLEGEPWRDLVPAAVESLLFAGLCFLLAARLFARRDLILTSDD